MAQSEEAIDVADDGDNSVSTPKYGHQSVLGFRCIELIYFNK